MKKLILDESIDYGDFNGLGTSNNPNDKRTNYKFTDKYISGNDESPDVLFRQVMNNYITDRGELETIQEILKRNHWDEEAKIVGYFIDEIDEEKQYGDDYSISRMKIDIADGYTNAGFKDVYEDNFKLSCYYSSPDSVIIELTDTDTWETDADKVPVEKFMNMTRKDFESWVNELAWYGNFEPNGGFPEDEE